jgi:hypothetical protein
MIIPVIPKCMTGTLPFPDKLIQNLHVLLWKLSWQKRGIVTAYIFPRLSQPSTVRPVNSDAFYRPNAPVQARYPRGTSQHFIQLTKSL